MISNPQASVYDHRVTEPTTSPFRSANHPPGLRHLYMLLAGVVLGVLLGPAVMGRFAPNVYGVLFIGGRDESQALAAFDAETRSLEQQLALTGVSVEAGEQLLDERLVESEPLRAVLDTARATHALRLLQAMIAIVVAMLAVMVIEPLIAPGSAARQRLATARYALAAMFAVLALARPQWVLQLPWLFLALLLAVAFVAVFVPLGRRRARS